MGKHSELQRQWFNLVDKLSEKGRGTFAYRVLQTKIKGVEKRLQKLEKKLDGK